MSETEAETPTEETTPATEAEVTELLAENDGLLDTPETSEVTETEDNNTGA